MKIIIKMLSLSCFLFLSATIFGQNKSKIRFGIEAGANYSTMIGDVESVDWRLGYRLGVTTDYTLSTNVYLASGLRVSSKGANMSKEAVYSGSSWDRNIKGQFSPVYLEMPIQIGFKTSISNSLNAIFQTGPILSYGMGGKSKLISTDWGSDRQISSKDVFSTNELKDFDLGFGVILGLELKDRITIKAGYDLGLTNIADNAKDERFRLRNVNASISLGYKF